MKLTVLGILVLPLSLIWALRPLRLVQIALVAAVFEAGAALVIGGGFGLPLAMVPGLLFIAYIIMQYALGMRYAAEGPVLRAVIPLLALLFYALLSVLLLPDAFAGTVMVWPQKADPIQPGLVPLAFNSGNVTQTLYLAMNITITVATALFLTHSKVSYRGIICAYLLGGYVVVGLAFWQFASRIAGVPFLDDVLVLKSWLGDRRTESGWRATHPGIVFRTSRPGVLFVRSLLLLPLVNRTALSRDGPQSSARACSGRYAALYVDDRYRHPLAGSATANGFDGPALGRQRPGATYEDCGSFGAQRRHRHRTRIRAEAIAFAVGGPGGDLHPFEGRQRVVYRAVRDRRCSRGNGRGELWPWCRLGKLPRVEPSPRAAGQRRRIWRPDGDFGYLHGSHGWYRRQQRTRLSIRGGS